MTTEWQVWITWSDSGKGGRQTFASEADTEAEAHQLRDEWTSGRRTLGPSARVHRVLLMSRQVTRWQVEA